MCDQSDGAYSQHGVRSSPVVLVCAEYVNAKDIPTDMKSITDRAAQTLLWTELFRGQLSMVIFRNVSWRRMHVTVNGIGWSCFHGYASVPVICVSLTEVLFSLTWLIVLWCQVLAWRWATCLESPPPSTTRLRRGRCPPASEENTHCAGEEDPLVFLLQGHCQLLA